MRDVTTGRRPSWLRAGLLIEVPAVIVTFVMMFFITINALLRTFADNPIQNTLEIVQYWLLPTAALLGFVAAQYRAQHIATDLVYKHIPRAAQGLVASIGWLLCAVLAAGFAWYGWGEAVHAYEIRRTAGVSTLPSWPVYFLVPAAFGILTGQWLLACVRAVRHGGEQAPVDALAPELDGIESIARDLR